MSSSDTLILGSIKIEKVYENGKFSYLEFKDLKDPECIRREFANGDKCWYLNEEPHREGAPAFESAIGDKFWFKEGKRHRQDGPAFQLATGHEEWYLDDIRVTEEEHLAINQRRAWRGRELRRG